VLTFAGLPDNDGPVVADVVVMDVDVIDDSGEFVVVDGTEDVDDVTASATLKISDVKPSPMG
jgi:hypothetical protein